MRRVWATVAAVWALLAVVALLAWSRPLPVSPSARAIPTALIVKRKNGTTRLVYVSTGTANVTHTTTRTSPPPR